MKEERAGKSLTTNIISFDKVVIISVNIIDNHATIAVKFISQQINYITGAQGDIIVDLATKLIMLKIFGLSKKI